MSVEASIGYKTTETTPSVPWLRRCLSLLGVLMYIMLNTCYTVAVFTDPGTPLKSSKRDTRGGKYSVLPTSEPSIDVRDVETITVSSTGGARYCKKCQVPKPDRTHHCSTCKRCVLKMDHHCPWLATCLGLHNYKTFVLFLIYTTLFCWVCFVSTAYWTWVEIFASRQYLSEFAPVQVIILAVLAGIIGLVITGFTAWHIYLCVRGQTTIECLEKTRYLAGVRRKVEQNRQEQQVHHRRGQSEGGISESLQRAGGQILEFHANAVPGVSRYEEGEEHPSPTSSVRHTFSQTPTRQAQYSDLPVHRQESPAQQALKKSYSGYEADRERERYEEYLDDKETSKMPNAFDLGWRKNLEHVFGPSRWLWFLPVCNTTGDGWRWEVSQKWMIASEEAARRKERRLQEARASEPSPSPQHTQQCGGAGRHYPDVQNNSYDDNFAAHGGGAAMSMQTFQRPGRRQRQDFDLAGEDGEVGSFEVSDSDGDSSLDSDR